ncbi:TonB-dependent receptor [Thalassotalea ganghwensis]
MSFKCSAEAEDREFFSLSLAELLNVQVVTAATGYNSSLETAPASVTVIEAFEWKAQGYTQLTEVLKGVAGIQLSYVNRSTAQWKPIIRGLGGAFTQQIKLLYDGIPLNGINIGSMPALDIPLDGLKRVEVLRSPGSATYGADAFAGIINLVPNDELSDSIDIVAKIGSFDTQQLSLTGSGEKESVKFFYSLSYHHYDDDPQRIIYSDLQSQLDKAFGINASLAPGRFDLSQEVFSFQAKIQNSLSALTLHNLKGHYGTGQGVAEALDPTGSNEVDNLLLDFKHYIFKNDKKFGDVVFQSWYQKQYYFHPINIFPPGSIMPIGSDGNINFVQPTTFTLFSDGVIGHPGKTSILTNVNISQTNSYDDHHIRWQIGYEKHQHKPTEQKNFGRGVLNGSETLVDGTLTDVTNTKFSYLPYKNRYFQFLSLQDQWQISSDVMVHLGLRVDHYSDFGTTTNPRVGVVWQFDEQLTFKIFSGKAFRAPAFFDLYAVNNPVNLGNPNLKPEKISTHEFNLSYQFNENLITNISLYCYSATQMYQYVDDGSGKGSVAKNVGELDGYGAEVNIRWRLNNKFDLMVNASHVNSEDKKGEQQPHYAKRFGSISLNYQLTERWHMNIFALYTGRQGRNNNDIRTPLASSVWYKGMLRYQLHQPRINWNLSIENLTDEKYYTPSNQIESDYPLPGRRVVLGLEYQY